MIRLAALALCVATAAQAQTQDGRFGSSMRYTEATGPAIWGAVCAACHMTDGQGAVGAGVYPSLAHDAGLAQAAYPITTVLRGRRAMPGFARTLTDEQVAAVVAYLRTQFGNDYADAPSAADVRALR